MDALRELIKARPNILLLAPRDRYDDDTKSDNPKNPPPPYGRRRRGWRWRRRRRRRRRWRRRRRRLKRMARRRRGHRGARHFKPCIFAMTRTPKVSSSPRHRRELCTTKVCDMACTAILVTCGARGVVHMVRIAKRRRRLPNVVVSPPCDLDSVPPARHDLFPVLDGDECARLCQGEE